MQQTAEAYELLACRSCSKLWVRIQTVIDQQKRRDGNPPGGWCGPEQAFTWEDCPHCRAKEVTEHGSKLRDYA